MLRDVLQSSPMSRGAGREGQFWVHTLPALYPDRNLFRA
jgi:hypothetical protein